MKESWTIPKGEIAEGEDLLERAKIEFEEELGVQPSGSWMELGSVKQKGGKTVHAWAFAGDLEDDFELYRTRSSWSGRRVQERCSDFLKWIEPAFSLWMKRRRKINQRRLFLSTG